MVALGRAMVVISGTGKDYRYFLVGDYQASMQKSVGAVED